MSCSPGVVDNVCKSRCSFAVNHALIESENKIDKLKSEIHVLQTSHTKSIKVAPIKWIEERLIHIQELLGQNVSQSAMVLRKLLRPIELETVIPESDRSYYVAQTTLETIPIVDKRIAPNSLEKDAIQYTWRPQGDLIHTLGSVSISITIIDAETIPTDQKIASKLKRMDLSSAASSSLGKNRT